MSRFAVYLLACGLHSGLACAQCEPVQALVREYGISYAGFEKSLPPATAPVWTDWAREDYRFVTLPRTAHVRDGYEHTVLVNATLHKAWIYRTGGFAGVHEWYGPVAVEVSDLTQCTGESKR